MHARDRIVSHKTESPGQDSRLVPSSIEESPTGRTSAPTGVAIWVRLALAAIGLGFVVAAIGGPGSLVGISSISLQVLIVPAASATAGALLMAALAFREVSLRAPTRSTNPSRPRELRIGLGVAGGVVLLVAVLRALTEATPVLGAVIWGFCGGLMLVGSVLPTKALLRPKR
jgi:hypothetical protein